MDFQAFEAQFNFDSPRVPQNFADADHGRRVPESLEIVRRLYAGLSFNEGLYRVMDQPVYSWACTFIETAFPDYPRRVISVSYDWLGRIFAIDLARSVRGDYAIAMFEPGTGQVLEIPANLETFHSDELITHRNEALADVFYLAWRSAGGRPPSARQCVGYRQPLFLNGQDSVQNLELVDIEVYWHLSAQIIHQTRGIPPGTRIDSHGRL